MEFYFICKAKANKNSLYFETKIKKHIKNKKKKYKILILLSQLTQINIHNMRSHIKPQPQDKSYDSFL